MRKSMIMLFAVLMPFAAMAAEVRIGLDRLAILNDQDDMNAESKLALHFALPQDVVQKEIVYAEMIISVPVAPVESDSLYELLFFPLLSDWREDNIDYDGCEGMTDSILVGSFMVKLGESDEFRIDVTPFVKEVVVGERTNHGLIAMADLLGDRNLKIPDNLYGPMRSAARVKIVYK